MMARIFTPFKSVAEKGKQHHYHSLNIDTDSNTNTYAHIIKVHPRVQLGSTSTALDRKRWSRSLYGNTKQETGELEGQVLQSPFEAALMMSNIQNFPQKPGGEERSGHR